MRKAPSFQAPWGETPPAHLRTEARLAPAAGRVGPMCGIVGYIGHRNATEVLLDGFRRLEYRGYDSAGVAVLNGKSR